MKWIGKVGAKPMLTINLSTRSLLEAARMWEYLRFPGGTTLSDQRRANGQDKPYDIRYWCLGNELYGAWEFGHRRPAGRPKAVRASAIYREKEGELVLFVVNRSSDETHELAVSLDGRWAVGESQELSGDETAKNAWGDERVCARPAGDVKVGDGNLSVALKPCSWRMIVCVRSR